MVKTTVAGIRGCLLAQQQLGIPLQNRLVQRSHASVVCSHNKTRELQIVEPSNVIGPSPKASTCFSHGAEKISESMTEPPGNRTRFELSFSAAIRHLKPLSPRCSLETVQCADTERPNCVLKPLSAASHDVLRCCHFLSSRMSSRSVPAHGTPGTPRNR